MELSNETEKMLIMRLLGLDGGANDSVVSNKSHAWVGRLVMIRTYAAGVHFGTLKEYDRSTRVAVLKDSHRVHYWKSACSLSQLVMEGDKDIDNARISMATDEHELSQIEEIMPMTQDVFDQLTSKIWKK